MRLIEKIGFDEMVLEWLMAEWYDRTPEEKKLYSHLIRASADLSNQEANLKRFDLLWRTRGEELKGLKELPFKWFSCEMESSEEFKNLWIIPHSNWYLITNKSFALNQITEDVCLDKRHGKTIREIKGTFSDRETIKGRLILVGSGLDKLTIVEGNHRAAALAIHGMEKGYNFFPLRVIVGLLPSIYLYPWSVERKDMEDHLRVCEEENPESGKDILC